jgi:peptide/nickel transport system substrate-binding protein
MGRQLSRREALGLLLGAGLWAVAGCRVPEVGQAARASDPTQPRPGGILKIGYHADPTTLDPHEGAPAALPLMGLVYSRLVRFRVGREVHPNQLIPEPDLVESWEQTDDLTYVFHLRKGVRFHNRPPVNGRELVAEDVRANLEWLTSSPDPRHRLHFGRIDRVEIPDKYTVKVILKEVTAPFIYYVAGPYGWILPRELVGQRALLRDTAVGTGPFVVHERIPGISIILKKNPEYFVAGRPFLDEVHWLVIPNETARLAYFRAGALDLLPPAVPTSPAEFELIRQALPEVQAEEVPGAEAYYLKVRADAGPLADRRARQALALAVDRQALLERLVRGHGVAAGPLSPALMEWVLPADRLGPAARYYRPDPELAHQLAAATGLPGLALRLGLPPGVAGGQTWLEVLQDQLGRFGIGLARGDGSAELNLQVYGFFLDPDEQLAAMFEGGGAAAADPYLAELVRRQRRILNKAARKQLIDEIQLYLAEQQYFIGLISASHFGLWQPHVRGYRPHSGPGSYELVDTWLGR